MPPIVTTSPSRRRSSSRDRRVRLAAQLVADRRERMLGDVEAEHLLLEAQQLVLLELVRRRPADGASASPPRPGRGRRSSPGRRAGRPAASAPTTTACSSTSSMPLREPGSAPHLTSASSTRLFETVGSTRSAKSQIDSNGPPSSRAEMIARAAPSPTPFTAFRPKRIFPSTTAKSIIDSFTSGGSTSMPSSWHALT